MLDAILRVLGRMFITRQHLLEWVASADVERRLKSKGASFFRQMWGGARRWSLCWGRSSSL